MGMLDGIEVGQAVFVEYKAGRAPTERACREARRAEAMGMPRRWFLGVVVRKWTGKNGDPLITVLCSNRDDERRGTQEGYRTFNPNLGELREIRAL